MSQIPPSPWTPEYTAQAKEYWRQYQEANDVSALRGQVAGIDPVSGRVWIGDDGVDVINKIKSDGEHGPVYFVRVGYDYLYRKGRR